MTSKKDTQELEKELVEYESIEKQLQILVLQKHQLQLQLNEINLASEELKKAKGEVYKSVGSLVVKTNKEDAEADLKERKGLIEVKLNTVSKQEEKLRTKLSGLQKELQEKLKEAQGKGA